MMRHAVGIVRKSSVNSFKWGYNITTSFMNCDNGIPGVLHSSFNINVSWTVGSGGCESSDVTTPSPYPSVSVAVTKNGRERYNPR